MGGREEAPAPVAAAAPPPPRGEGRNALLPPSTTPPDRVEAEMPVARESAAKKGAKGPTLASKRVEEDRKVEYEAAYAEAILASWVAPSVPVAPGLT